MSRCSTKEDGSQSASSTAIDNPITSGVTRPSERPRATKFSLLVSSNMPSSKASWATYDSVSYATHGYSRVNQDKRLAVRSVLGKNINLRLNIAHGAASITEQDRNVNSLQKGE